MDNRSTSLERDACQNFLEGPGEKKILERPIANSRDRLPKPFPSCLTSQTLSDRRYMVNVAIRSSVEPEHSRRGYEKCFLLDCETRFDLRVVSSEDPKFKTKLRVDDINHLVILGPFPDLSELSGSNASCRDPTTKPWVELVRREDNGRRLTALEEEPAPTDESDGWRELS